jgi:hypothetical protein
MAWVAVLLGVASGAIGVVAWEKASSLEENAHQHEAPVFDPRVEALESNMHGLEARLAALEAAARNASRAPSPVTRAAVLPPPTADSLSSDAGPAVDPGDTAAQDRQKSEERVLRVGATVDAYWKGWGANHGLTQSQIDALASLQVEAAKRRLDDAAKLASHEITRDQGKADIDEAVEDVRQKARDLLTAEQFAQFEADKGAEWGSSYRKVRESHSRAQPALP